MLFNVDKCRVIRMGCTNIQAEYVMNDVKLNVSRKKKILGVIVSDDLKSKKQCSAAVM